MSDAVSGPAHNHIRSRRRRRRRHRRCRRLYAVFCVCVLFSVGRLNLLDWKNQYRLDRIRRCGGGGGGGGAARAMAHMYPDQTWRPAPVHKVCVSSVSVARARVLPGRFMINADAVAALLI